MRIRMVMVGRNAPGPVTEAFEEMLGRLQRSFPVDQVVVADPPGTDPERKRREGTDRLLKAVERDTLVVLLDERGEGLSSTAFAARLGRWRDQGTRQVAFVIGGAYGVDDRMRARATQVIALSPMTFTHQLVRLVLAEQLYRAAEILRGSGYHH
ncbi:MAG: 23S rRNA (pseudouridine(1915)-N(3))-methyltransferase RlmH [Flavobacteriales bacterium]|nr:23S rRNA (pseudouridine(1915)-N(3))-methyltransferase RlmH [Flavobacteriales bacterium]